MTDKNKPNHTEDSLLKKEIGKRFKQFRQCIYKSQEKMAKGLGINQSTIAHIEAGDRLPDHEFLLDCYRKYNLNCNWLITGSGRIFVLDVEKQPGARFLLPCRYPEGHKMYRKYLEMIELMEVPAIQLIIIGRLEELKLVAREEIEALKKEKTMDKW